MTIRQSPITTATLCSSDTTVTHEVLWLLWLQHAQSDELRTMTLKQSPVEYWLVSLLNLYHLLQQN